MDMVADRSGIAGSELFRRHARRRNPDADHRDGPSRRRHPRQSKRTISSRNCSPPAWGWCASATRPEYDTAPPCPVWAHRSDAAAPPPRNRISVTADAILIMGSSMAENHPVGFQWVMEARERRAKIIHVDPRFTRTSAMADIWVPLRAGSDIIFLGALVQLRSRKQRVISANTSCNYTNAPLILREDFRDTEDLDGLFSGWDAEKKKYDPETWLYHGTPRRKARVNSPATRHRRRARQRRGGEAQNLPEFESDPTLQHPRCVFQVLKRHFARYTPEMVERYCGIPKEVFLKAAETFTRHRVRTRPAPSAMRSAGRSIPRACRSFAPPRFCNCCWEISGGRAAEFSRCAATPRFRARPIFPRSTTFFPATCRCRSSKQARTS